MSGISGITRWPLGLRKKLSRDSVPTGCSLIVVLSEYCNPQWSPLYTLFKKVNKNKDEEKINDDNTPLKQ